MPDIDHFEIGNEIALPELYALCKESLCDVSRIFDINAAPPSQSAPEPLGEALQGNPAGQLLSPNLLQLLRSASFKVNCFAIYTRQSGEPWRMRYLGEAAVQRGRAVLSACLLPVT